MRNASRGLSKLIALAVLVLAVGVGVASAKGKPKDRGNGHGNGNGKEHPTKVEVCHKGHTISISSRALHAHVGHGDTAGACGSSCEDDCPQGGERVLCEDGHTYTNACTAACAGQSECHPSGPTTCG